MEHFYQNIDGWFDFQSVYSKAVATARDGAHFVEVGSWLGKSTAYMAVEIVKSHKKIRFDAVDTWQGSPEAIIQHVIDKYGVDAYEQFLKNLWNVLDVVIPIRLPSVHAARLYRDNSLDFVYIDADHRYEFVKQDILAWRPKIKKGGVIAGHDYTQDHPGVIKSVNEIFGTPQVDYNSWWIRNA